MDDAYVGLIGKTGDEAEIPLAELEEAGLKGHRQLITFLADKTKRSESAIEKLLARSQDVVQGKDAEMRRLLNTACDNKRDLTTRIAPFVYALRKDLHGLPVVFNAGSLVVKQTRARRDSGTEYTPRELAEETVQYELEPLVYSPGPRDGSEAENWKLRPSKELLNLKICDPAVGSGAFLVSACRYLADRVVEAWISEDPNLENANRDDLTLDARRAVVDRCLYGVDRDSMAVEMAKLSLWLITMARERPFSFLDHSIREGDSLLGITSLDQLIYAHVNPAAGRALYDGALFELTSVIRPLVERAAELRRELETLPSMSIRDAETKQRLNEDANAVVEIVQVVADAIVSTALSTATLSEKQRNAAFQATALRIGEVLHNATGESIHGDALTQLRTTNEQMLNGGRPYNSPVRKTLHWPIAYPEVFGAGGFDAVLGNPPFVGGKKITGAFGVDFREYLVNYVASGRKGHADLVGYFFLRAADISKSFAFLAVNTISQGDTREVCLDALLQGGWTITRATKSRPWPGAAGIHISQIWLSRECGVQQSILDGRAVAKISGFLLPAQRLDGKPFRLKANDGIAFQGSIVLGMGFIMSPERANALIAEDRKNSDVLFPYLNAEDLCSRPDASPSRSVINFFDWSVERAESYQAVFTIAEKDVRPERQRLNPDGDFKLRKPLPQRWWQYADKRPALYRAISGLRNVTVMPQTSKVMLPLRYPTDIVFSHMLIVIASDSDAMFGVLTSSVHREWARKYSSTLETRNRYIPTDCFLTFPFIGEEKAQDVAKIANDLDALRSKVMLSGKMGLTSLYNTVHDASNQDASVGEIRSLHADLDAAVCRAYGWQDVDLKYGFHLTDEGERWTFCNSARQEILDRLLELNHARYRDEMVAFSATSSDGKRKRGKRAATPIHDQQMALY